MAASVGVARLKGKGYNFNMLQLSGALLDQPVLSLRIGRPIARTLGPLINPNNLKIEGFYCQQHENRKPSILLGQDIRDIMAQGVVVNDQEALTDPDELIRLKDIIQLNFEIIGKPVVTSSKERIGKVSDYSVELDGLFIQKLYVTQPLLKSLSGGNLGVDRSQIIEITDKAIVIQDLQSKVPAAARAVA
jgi:sporulation protein YlmC with PRC-barrel domain